MPVGFSSFADGLRAGCEIFHALKKTLHDRGLGTTVGDEGGFAPDLDSNEQALEMLLAGIEAAGYRPGEDLAIALDPAVERRSTRTAPTSWSTRGAPCRRSELTDYWADKAERYPIISLEDGMDEEDWDGWKLLTDRLGEHLQLVGDDLFVTNTERLKRGIDSGTANSILVKVNQIGTLTETLEAVEHGPRGRLHRGDVAPLRRDRGRDDRRPRGGHRLRPDQDRRPVAHRPRGEVQPAPADRGGARAGREVPGALGVPERARARLIVPRHSGSYGRVPALGPRLEAICPRAIT